MNILLSNDDGYHAPGLQALRSELQKYHDVITVAPDRDRSGASNSLTLTRPLRLSEKGRQLYSIDGTPTDCIQLALGALYAEKRPDIVISGINSCTNLGDDSLYSGTVAAAIEGRFLAHTPIAVSLDSGGGGHIETAVKAVMLLLGSIKAYPLYSRTTLNVNVPDLPWEAIKGFQVTRLGRRHEPKAVIRSHDPRGRELFWLGPIGEVADDEEGTDFHAVHQGYISVSPLHTDLTHHHALAQTRQWLDESPAPRDFHV